MKFLPFINLSPFLRLNFTSIFLNLKHEFSPFFKLFKNVKPVLFAINKDFERVALVFATAALLGKLKAKFSFA